MSDEEQAVWEYLLKNKTASALEVAINCSSSVEFAQRCIDRIGTPREVFEKELRKELRADEMNQPREVTPTRVQTLETAIKLTAGDRNKAYGPPHRNLSDCALLWDAYLAIRNGAQLDAEAVAWMNVLQKIARSAQPGYHPDNYTDAAAYSAIAGECREIDFEIEMEKDK
jgi:hypothetical protein